MRRLTELHPGAAASAVALTLDDGPDTRTTPQVLDLLAALGITASFCVIGSQVGARRDLVGRIAREGHSVVNHTQDHPLQMASLSSAELARQIAVPQQVLGDVLGAAPRLFRCPGGEWSPQVLAATEHAGLTPLGWSVDPRDWSKPGVAVITGKLLLAAAGDIVLCHDGGGDRSQTVEALRSVLPQLQRRGTTFIPL